MMKFRKFSALFAAVIVAFIIVYYNLVNRKFRHGSYKSLFGFSSSKAGLQIKIKLKPKLHCNGDHLNAVEEIISQSSPDRNSFVIHHYKIKKQHNCAITKYNKSEVDVQMSSMYERILYDNNSIDWHNAWNIPFKQRSKNKLKVFIIPFSHFDLGRLVTLNSCYMLKIRAIFKNMLEKLLERPDRKFIWTDTYYLQLWWSDPKTTSDEKLKLQTLLKTGKLEIVSGGWVMNAEVNSHWISIVQQLATGHQWLLDHLNYIPENTWQIESFSHSSSQAYLNKLAGFEHGLIQRVHYRIKKELASSRQLEFRWRQLWDDVGKTDMFTHLTPYRSYDVSHSCGPDPMFDFKRLLRKSTTDSVKCPLGVQPKKITTENVQERANLILEQWHNKSQLYLSKVVMFPLGDDGRYVDVDDWDAQYQNYEMIMDYINNRTEFNTEVRFGTLSEYFKAVQSEVHRSKFPVLSGDFLTYADWSKQIWSGYFTTRPFYKYLDRVLLSYLRAAESILALAVSSQSVTEVTSLQLRDSVEQARRALALFQHHDGEDFAINVLDGIKSSQSVLQRAAYLLLKKPAVSNQTQDDVYFVIDEVWRRHDQIPLRTTITLRSWQPKRRLVLYNALAFTRHEIFTVFVSTPNVQVHDSEGSVVKAQVSPLVSGPRMLRFAVTRYQLCFLASVKPLSIAVYTVSLRNKYTYNDHTSYARVRVYNFKTKVQLPTFFPFLVTKLKNRKLHLTIQAGNASPVVAIEGGLIKAVFSRNLIKTPINMHFVRYENCTVTNDVPAFIPTTPAVSWFPKTDAEMVVIEGLYKSTFYIILSKRKKADVMMAISVYDNPSLPHTEVEIINTLLIHEKADDMVLAMRFSTAVKNKDVFYTDHDGMGMMKQRNFEKLPVQANYYPLSGAAYIEDNTTRVTLLTFTPLAVAALKPGSIEVMQDGRLRSFKNQVHDNIRTRHTFRLLVEQANTNCKSHTPELSIGKLSLGAHVSQQQLLQPMISMQYSPSDDSAPHYSSSLSSAADIVLASYRAHVSAKDQEGKILHGLGMTFQRVLLDKCFGYETIRQWYPLRNGEVCISELVAGRADEMWRSSLTHVRARAVLGGGVLSLCPMDVRSVFVRHDLL